MQTIEVITLVTLFLISVGAFVMSYFQLKEKGFLLNNAYIYATKETRKTMNKKPHYRQSAIVFFQLGIIFLLMAIEMLLDTGWILGIVIGLMILLIIYAIVSSIKILKKY